MEKTNQNEVFTKEIEEKKAGVNELFEEVVEVITDTFVATYQKEGTSLIMRFVNGQKYRLTVQEEV